MPRSASEPDPPLPGAGTSEFLVGLARAFGGAILFSLPLLMTMEMWQLGFHMDRGRLAAFMIVMIPLLIALDHFSGFRETSSWIDDAADALTAYGVAFIASIAILILIGILSFRTPIHEAVGMIALQAVPAAFGAVLASSLLKGDEDDDGSGSGLAKEERERLASAGYHGELLFMVAGAVFLGFNFAPTQETIVIAADMTEIHLIALLITSILLMHAIVYAANLRGTPGEPKGTRQRRLFFRSTLMGYMISLAISAYILWTFGRADGAAFSGFVTEIIILAFPSSLGAASARLLL